MEIVKEDKVKRALKSMMTLELLIEYLLLFKIELTTDTKKLLNLFKHTSFIF